MKMTMSEVASKLNRSAAWIGKVQRETGQPKKNGIRGERKYYSKDDLNYLKKVKFLVSWEGFSYKEIRELISGGVLCR